MNRVRQIRQEKGWSLTQLARACSVSKSHLSNIERGYKEPTLSVARRVARALQADLDEVFPAICAEPSDALGNEGEAPS